MSKIFRYNNVFCIKAVLEEGRTVCKYQISDRKLMTYSKDSDNILLIPQTLIKNVLEGRTSYIVRHDLTLRGCAC